MTINPAFSTKHLSDRLKLVLLASACTASLGLATGASAQGTTLATATPAAAPATSDAAPDANAPTDIVVSGFRSSLKSAMDAKRNDIRMSDGISAEDIGKFPAENITEAIQRIAGVQMSNINGRGSTISIRGLGAQYARTTINGQTFASADFKDGFRYDIIQTDLANAIQVYKSPTADMDTGGLSGTVNIDTIHPLDYKGPHLTLTAKGYDNLYRGAVTPKVGAAYINSFADGTVGVMLNVDYQKLMDRGDYVFIDRWYHPADTSIGAYVPKRFRYRRIDRNTEQLMASGALQWKPTDNLETLFQAEFSRDHTTYNTQQLVYAFGDSSKITANNIANGVANKITVASGSTLDNNDQSERRDLQTQAYTATLNWKPDGWKIHAAAHYTVGTAHLYEWASILGMNINSPISLDISNPNNVSFKPTQSLTDGSFYNNKSAYNWYAFYDGAYHFQTSKEAALQLDTTKEIYNAPIKSLVFGVKYHHESFATQAYRHDRDADPSDTTTYPEINYIPDMTGSGSTLVTNFLGNSMSIPHSFLEVNAPVWQQTLDSHGITVPVTYDASNSWRVDRYIPAVYAMANIDTHVFGKTLRGNLGVRYEHTHQNVTANAVDGNGTFLNRTNTIQDYGNVLPSAAFALDVTKHFVTRLALAKVLVRPLLNSDTVMATSITTGTASGRPYVAVAGGESNLKPMTANQADLSLEYYYGRGNSFTVAGFYKAIKNGTYTSFYCPGSYNGVTLAGGSTNCTSANGGTDYSFSQVLNDSEVVHIRGVEVAWSQGFDQWLPFKGAGVTTNLTVVDPDNVTLGNGFHLRNLSKLTWNLTPYWENETFSVRVSINHRSAYDQDYADSFFAGYGETHTVRARTQVDLALGYTMNKHISFTAGVINLNNSHEDAYYQNSSTFQMASRTGRNVYASVTGKF